MRTAAAYCSAAKPDHPSFSREYPEGDENSEGMALMVVARAWNSLAR